MNQFALKPKQLFAWMLMGFFLLTGAIVGFDESKDGKRIFDGEKIGKEGECPERTIAKLELKYNISQAKAKEKILNIQKNVRKSIELIAKSHPRIAKCLKDAQESGRLCIEFAAPQSTVGVTKISEPGCAGDRVNINWPYLRGCDSIGSLDLGFIYLTNVLLHEGVHMLQPTKPANLGPGDSKIDSLMKGLKLKFQNELDAIDSTQNIWCPLRDSLKAMLARGGGAAPNPLPGGVVGGILKGLNDLPTNFDRRLKALQMLAEVEEVKKANKIYRLQNLVRKIIVCKYLDREITLQEAIRLLRHSGLLKFQDFYDGLPGTLVYPDTTGFLLIQQRMDTLHEIFHDLPLVTDFFFMNPGQMVMVGPFGSSQSVLIGLEDVNQDGLLEDSSLRFLLPIPNAPDGMDLIPFPDGRLLGFNYAQQQLFEFVDMDRDGFPDQLLPQPLSIPLPVPVVDWIASPEDPRVLFGFPVRQDGFQTILPGETYYVLQDTDSDNFYETLTEENRLQNIITPPVFLDLPQINDQLGDINGTAFAEVELVELNPQGDSIASLGVMMLDSVGNGSLNFAQALIPNQLLQLRDRLTGMNSILYQLDNANSVDGLAEEVALNIYPQPARNYLNVSLELQTLQEVDIHLYSLQAQKISHWNFSQSQAGSQGFHLELPDLTPGFYVLNIHLEKGIISKKVWIKQN